jgi:hypothetical protein
MVELMLAALDRVASDKLGFKGGRQTAITTPTLSKMADRRQILVAGTGDESDFEEQSS